jgi:hypothetical protein
VGAQALATQSFSGASGNVAVGSQALAVNQPTTSSNGVNNTAVGTTALLSNTTGSSNTASGFQALYANTTGNYNTAMGINALKANNTGSNNTATGFQALYDNTTGSSNTAIGYFANVASGALTNATAIGAFASVNASNKVRIGGVTVTVIEGQVAFTASSDRNLKENFQPVDGDEVLRKIRGFNLTSWNFIGHDPKQFRHYGPMAQDFYAAFGHDSVGGIGTETTINSGDIAGILMSAVQALSTENVAMREENAAMTKRLAELEAKENEREARLVKLEQLIPPH